MKKLVLLLLFLSACSGSKAPERELRIYTWSGYFTDGILKDFENENHVHIKADFFSSNEELLAKLQLSIKSADDGYDLVLPSDYMIRNMIELKLLKPLDHSKMPFLKDFDPHALKADYDPGLHYAVPMAIGTTGIAVNTKLLPKLNLEKLTWRDVFENPAYAGKVTLLDDSKEVLQAVLLTQGKDLGRANASDIQNAFAYLQKNKKNIKAFLSETRPSVEADECALCQLYSGDALSIGKEKPEIRFVLPQEGASIWADNFAIPLNAKNEDLAYLFMNKVLSAEGAKRFTENIHYRTANLKSRALLDPQTAKNPTIFPPESTFKKLHYIVDRKELLMQIDRQWTELKSK